MSLDASSCSKAAAGLPTSTSIFGFGPRVQRMSDVGHFLDHFGVVEVPDAQKDRDLETYGCTVDPKRDTNLRILLASRIYLDACHCDLKFAHPVTRIARAA